MIGIIGAMDIEVDGIINELDGMIESYHIAGRDFTKGILENSEVVIVKCGVGKVNAACATQAMIDKFKVDAIINTGVAGSLDNRIDISDIVISGDVVQHDMDITALGYPKGKIPETDSLSFKAERELVEIAIDSARKELTDVKVFEGRIASGDEFINSDEKKTQIVEEFNATCCEMEGGAVAQVCVLNSVPFVVIRAISDKADGSSHMDYPVFEAKAADNSIKLINAMIDKISDIY
ncbi:methylthioadenosine nucleosidase [Eubacterium uniforme]|uniref:adenosylhomocysteine nucleosidase n=1 Tax=Eubacterium uniforme TaxID=39495 RepID=A0A1T4VDU1_9FIRM|nr:5'-methylthioadenosine/adenosylhomocysteine nucleosidase [Eubacterium uniforme]SKA63134.1 methylthioadenosine nucleosidase [Eubacterium uniforme]